MRGSRFVSSDHKRFVLLFVVLSLALFIEAAAQAKPQYAAEIRRTSHGIPHITAKDYGRARKPS